MTGYGDVITPSYALAELPLETAEPAIALCA
jgi:hypothetical protein